jgi:hypothetical protein
MELLLAHHYNGMIFSVQTFILLTILAAVSFAALYLSVRAKLDRAIRALHKADENIVKARQWTDQRVREAEQTSRKRFRFRSAGPQRAPGTFTRERHLVITLPGGYRIALTDARLKEAFELWNRDPSPHYLEMQVAEPSDISEFLHPTKVE